jgi:hypothetical protein
VNYRRWIRGAKFWLWALALVAYAVVAAGMLIIDTAEQRYGNLSQVRLVTVKSEEQARRVGATQVAAIYRAQSGMPFSTLPAGSTFQIVWPDGSTETMVILDARSGASGMAPVTGSQQQAAAQE